MLFLMLLIASFTSFDIDSYTYKAPANPSAPGKECMCIGIGRDDPKTDVLLPISRPQRPPRHYQNGF